VTDTEKTATWFCPTGYYCPSKESFDIAGTTYRKIPCPKGTYNDITFKVKLSDCKPCPAGLACEELALTAGTEPTLKKCAKGFWCASSAETRWPTTTRIGFYGPCPAGYYCPEGSTSLNPANACPPGDACACPEGTFSAQEGAWSIDFCLPCPPGWLCTTAGGVGGLTAPS